MEKFIDHEGWLENPPSLKSIFDNLRNYPLLAILFAASWAIFSKETFLSELVGGFLFIILGALFILSLAQTCILVTSLVLNSFFHNSPKPKGLALAFSFIMTLLFGFSIFFSVFAITIELISYTSAR